MYVELFFECKGRDTLTFVIYLLATLKSVKTDSLFVKLSFSSSKEYIYSRYQVLDGTKLEAVIVFEVPIKTETETFDCNNYHVIF